MPRFAYIQNFHLAFMSFYSKQKKRDMSARGVLKQTLQTTSLKGIPRAVKARSAFLRTVWTVAVIVFLSMCLFQVVTIVKEYLEFETVTTREETPIGNNWTGDGELFPRALVCNLNPFSSNQSNYKNGFPTPVEYAEKVINMTICEECTEAEKKEMDLVRDVLLRSRSYYQHVGKQKASEVSHQSIVIECKVLLRVTFINSYLVKSCDDHVTVTKVFLPKYFNCFLYEAKMTSGMIMGFSFLLHLDTSFKHLHGLLANPLTQGMGALISLLPQNYSLSIEHSTSIAPGFHTDITFTITQIKRYKYYCKENITNQDLCFSECFRSKLSKLCKCKNAESVDQEGDFCYAFHNNSKEAILNLYDCVRNYSAKNLDCENVCPTPCVEVRYDKSSSMSKFLSVSQLGDFYKNFIIPSGLSEKYNTSGFRMIAEGKGEEIPDTMMLSMMNMIESNFAQVTIHLANRNIIYYTEHLKTTLSGLFSQLGGILNLWSGITAIILIELIEAIYRLFTYKSEEKAPEKDLVKTQNE